MNSTLQKALVCATIAALPLTMLTAAGCKKAAPQSIAEAGPAPISVESVAASMVDVPATLRVTGSLRGFRETDLAANAAGRVTQTVVERGSHVIAGQILVQLDTRAASLTASEARAQADSVRAQETQAKSECDRYEKLRAKGAITDLEFDRVATQCRTLPLSAEAATARARLAAQNVGDGAIRAPFAGVITERTVDVGEYVRQDTRIATLVALDQIRLEMAVPEAYVAKLKENSVVGFRVAAHPERLFKGTVRFVSGAVRPTSRDLVAEAVVDNADKALLPGMFADVELEVGRRQLPGVPRAALTTKDGQKHAFVVTGGRIEERVLATGPEAGELVSVTRGITAGERVVIKNIDALSNGQPVL